MPLNCARQNNAYSSGGHDSVTTHSIESTLHFHLSAWHDGHPSLLHYKDESYFVEHPLQSARSNIISESLISPFHE